MGEDAIFWRVTCGLPQPSAVVFPFFLWAEPLVPVPTDSLAPAPVVVIEANPPGRAARAGDGMAGSAAKGEARPVASCRNGVAPLSRIPAAAGAGLALAAAFCTGRGQVARLGRHASRTLRPFPPFGLP